MSVVEELTRQAVHKRDHDHPRAASHCDCAVETVSLGHMCFVVCHDCRFDSPLMPLGAARDIALRHCCPTQ